MDIGTFVDWVCRILGMAFILFLLSVLFFPSWRESVGEATETDAELPAPVAICRNQRRHAPDAEPVMSHNYEKILIFPDHRRVHR